MKGDDLAQRFVLTEVSVQLGDWRVTLEKPRSAEDLISEVDFARDERLPYWADLWPAATELARYLNGSLNEEGGEGLRALELGCGLGLVSIAAIRAGFDVLATDYYDDACAFTAHNARRVLGRAPATRMVDWRAMPSDLGTFDLVLAADVLYERPYAPLIADAVAATLAPGGVVLLADQGRVGLSSFLDEAQARGIAMQVVRTVPPPAGVQAPTVTIYRGQR